MIMPQDFLDRWDRETYGLVSFDEEVIQSYSLSQATKDFLLTAGLPESAPPFLTFESTAGGGGMRLTEKYDGAVPPSLSTFIYIGYTGSGDPICIDEENDKVVWIDGEKDSEKTFVNSTIAQLAEALLIYVEFIRRIKAEGGRKAFLERNAAPEALAWAALKLKEADPHSLAEGSFWAEELGHYRK